MLDGPCWLCSIRGADIDQCPVVPSHAFVGVDDAVLYVEAEKVDAGMREHLAEEGLRIESYDIVVRNLRWLAEREKLAFGSTVHHRVRRFGKRRVTPRWVNRRRFDF